MYLLIASNETGSAIQNALNSVGPGGTVALTPGATYYVTGLTIPPAVTLVGSALTIDNPAGANLVDLIGQQGCIYLENSGTITLRGASCLRNMIVVRADNGVGMPLPATSVTGYRGDAITPIAATGSGTATRGADGYMIDNVLCIGHARALVSVGASRATVNRFRFDANPGIAGAAAVSFTGPMDTLRVNDIQGWQFGMTAATGNALRRVGTGLYFGSQIDDGVVEGVKVNNYDINVDLQATGSLTLGRVSTDTKVLVGGSRGVRFGVNASNVIVDGLRASGSETGIESAAVAGNRNFITSATVEAVTGSAVLVSSGNLNLGTVATRNLAVNQPVMTILSTTSVVSGTIVDETTGTTPSVVVPTGATTSQFDDLRVYAPNRPAGTVVIGGANVNYQPIPAADPLLLPTIGRTFKVTGTPSIHAITGGHGGRRIRLKFSAVGTLFNTGGNMSHASGTNRTVSASSIIEYEFDGETNTWNEVSWKP